MRGKEKEAEQKKKKKKKTCSATCPILRPTQLMSQLGMSLHTRREERSSLRKMQR